MQNLSKFENLRALTVMGTATETWTIKGFQRLRHLNYLRISGNVIIQDSGIDEVTTLVHLSVHDSNVLGHHVEQVLRNNESLQYLDFSGKYSVYDK